MEQLLFLILLYLKYILQNIAIKIPPIGIRIAELIKPQTSQKIFIPNVKVCEYAPVFESNKKFQ